MFLPKQEDMDLGIQWCLMWLVNPNDIIELNIGENHTIHCHRHGMSPRLCVSNCRTQSQGLSLVFPLKSQVRF